MKKKRGKVVLKGSKMNSHKKEKVSILKGISKGLPSLTLAYQLTERASRLGFDWPDLKGVLKKLDEEMKEFREALFIRNRKKIREELGDLLFVLVNTSRFLRVNPEEALRKTLEKFISRFHYIETSLHKKGKSFHQSNLMEMDRLWEESKKKEEANDLEGRP
jgi:tetrapyrrole methylase family protein/MazG family protein